MEEQKKKETIIGVPEIKVDQTNSAKGLPEFCDAINSLRIRNTRIHYEKPSSKKSVTACEDIFNLFKESGLSYLESKRVLDYVNQELLRQALERPN